ncbi:hypothetical protein CRG98_022896 [Punica granatum]|uniref:Uncharacterized protein n=1 Tax=Punica granatum TaxID=22663 RepID=A0A2I0JMJ9_PUNGR|nr:hypothetical protein CRG98_022896 [Punica granatum]
MATKEDPRQIGLEGFATIDRHYARPPPEGPPRNIQFSRLFPAKQQNPPKRMSEGRELPPVGPYQVRYPPQEPYVNRPVRWFPAEKTVTIDIVKLAQLDGGITWVDYGRFK